MGPQGAPTVGRSSFPPCPFRACAPPLSGPWDTGLQSESPWTSQTTFPKNRLGTNAPSRKHVCAVFIMTVSLIITNS